MKHEMTLFHTMGPNKNFLFQTHLSCNALLTKDYTGPFESPLLPRTPLYLVTCASGTFSIELTASFGRMQ